MKRFLAIGFIWFGCAFAWMILGATIDHRSGESSGALHQEVHRLWGPPVSQTPPAAIYREVQKVREKITSYAPNGVPVESIVEKEQTVEHPIALDASDVAVKLGLEHRQKGLLWFPTYTLDFRARYTFRNTSPTARDIELRLPLAHDNVSLDGFEVLGEDGQPVNVEILPDQALWRARFSPDERRSYAVAFKTRGTTSWEYRLATYSGQVKDFRMVVETDFDRIDFPAGSISPTQHQPTATGWSGVWEYKSLITGASIGLQLPQKLNPGPVASRITFFAPVGLLFFFFVVSILAVAQGKSIHPANYFFFGCAFFAFHLLFAYLVDHVALFPSFAISSAASIFLIVTYARLFVGWKFSLREMGLAQLIYLVLFSFTFFWDGFTGLSITIGAVLTLFAMMQMTGRLDWRSLPSARPPSGPTAPGAPLHAELQGVHRG